MKNLIMPFVLMSALVIWQGCTSKAEEAKNETVKTISEEKADAKFIKTKNEEILAKRARIAKATAEKEAERLSAIAEKMKTSPTYKDATGKLIYHKAEIDPSYTGGFGELRKYLKDNIKYPEAARENGQEATVFVEFVVDVKGNVREVVAAEVVGDEFDDAFKTEAVRVVSTMPGWNPGRQQGKPVNTSFSIPITFQLEN
jgi:TonB family protein